jgi:putative transposase
MRYRFISEHRSNFPVKKMCQTLAVSRSGYFRWLGSGESRRVRENRMLLSAIGQEHQASDRNYGALPITKELRGKGWRVGHNRVARIMREHGIRPVVKRRFRVTTNSRHGCAVAANLLNRNFQASTPNRVWVTDITYVRTAYNWAYVCVFIDLYSRIIVGWAVSRALDQRLVADALERAVARRRPQAGLIVHSDRGIQYASDLFKAQLSRHGFQQSMSRKGDCWDNAVAESFFATLKRELISRYHFANCLELERALFRHIEIWYNRVRRHSSIDYLAPEAFEAKTLCA